MLGYDGPKWVQFKKNWKDSVESRGVTTLTKSWGSLDGFLQEQTKLQGMEEESKKREEQIISDLEVQLEWNSMPALWLCAQPCRPKSKELCKPRIRGYVLWLMWLCFMQLDREWRETRKQHIFARYMDLHLWFERRMRQLESFGSAVLRLTTRQVK